MLLTAVRAADPATTFDVKAFGALGDGLTLDTAAIQRTIEACHAAGGGTVVFPAGNFLSATITLRSNITLDLSPGAVLLGSTRLADYPVRKHLIFADGVENIALTGHGAIDGQGDAFFDQNMRPLPERLAQLIEIENSRGIRVEGITVRKSGNWTFRVRHCDDVKIRGLSILNNLHAINTDGLQIDTSRNVFISDCRIETGDDCIVLKGGAGSAEAPIENVTVTNCVLRTSESALKFGTGTARDFRHCLFTNIVIRDSTIGIALMMKDGGTIEDVRFSNIAITTAPKSAQNLEWPILVDVERRTNASRLGHIRDVVFSGVTIYSKGRVLVEGMPGSPIEGIAFRDVALRLTGYENIARAKKPHGGSKRGSDDSLDYAKSPGAFIFAYVRGLDLEAVTVAWPAGGGDGPPPERNALFGDHVAEARLTGLRANGSTPRTRAIELRDSPEPLP